MAEREVILGSHVYRDAKGSLRTARRGEVIDLSEEEIERGEALEAIGPVGTVAELDAQQAAASDLANLDDEALALWVEEHTADEVVAESGDPEVAQRLLDAESARKKPRKTVLDGISAGIEASAA